MWIGRGCERAKGVRVCRVLRLCEERRKRNPDSQQRSSAFEVLVYGATLAWLLERCDFALAASGQLVHRGRYGGG